MSVYMTIISLASALLLFIYWVNQKLTYWKNRGLQNKKPLFILGNTARLLNQNENFSEHIKTQYDYLKSKKLPHGGEYFLLKPIYIPIDPHIIKHMLQNDFDYFMDRGIYHNEKHDPISGNLFFIEGKKWKTLRSKLTPTFTSGKMKMMFDILIGSSQQLKIEIAKNLDSPVNMKDLFLRYTVDVIGSCVFGIDCNSLNDPESEFKYCSEKFLLKSRLRNFKESLAFIIPDIMETIGFVGIDKSLSKFVFDFVGDNVRYREENNIERNDFMHLLIQLKNTGKIDDEYDTSVESKISFNELVAQAFVFLLGGLETSSTTMSFTLFELASNQELQMKLRKEINGVFDKNDGVLNYDSLMEMKYLDMVISETLRKYPPLPSLLRICVEAYDVPGTDVTLEKGTKVFVPVYALHHDEDHFPNPSKYDPERFSDENKKNIKPFTYLPFGKGPRGCIGERFGKLMVKVALITVIRNFEFTLNSKTKMPLKMDPSLFVLSAKGDVWLNGKTCVY